jgi:hypothetical protein
MAPWRPILGGAGGDGLAEVLAALLDLIMCAPADVLSAHRRLATASALHGSARREQGYSESILFSEYTLVRRVLWSRLRQTGAGEAEALQVVLWLDIGLSITTQAALLGYHRAEFEAAARWPDVLCQVEVGSPFLRSIPLWEHRGVPP